jgi:hypothetical protein
MNKMFGFDSAAKDCVVTTHNTQPNTIIRHNNFVFVCPGVVSSHCL